MEKLAKNYISELSTGVLVLDKSLSIQYLNSSAQSMLDISLKASRKKQLNKIFYEQPDSLQNFKSCLTDNRDFAKADALLFLKGGKKLLCDYHVHPFSNLSLGEGLIVEIMNKEYSNEIKDRLRTQTNQEVTSAFIRGLAHEIKNPLSGIRGAAQLLSHKLPDQHLKEYTEIVINQTDRLTSLVDNILGPNKKPSFLNQNIHIALENVITLVQHELGEEGIEISKDYDPSIPELFIDIYLFEQSILNLVKNAKESLVESDTISPKIKICTRIMHQEFLGKSKHKTVCKISVLDNGPGIPENMKESIFFPMISGKSQGSGLGLSITQGIVSQHKGTVRFESEPGKTEFSILMPIENSIQKTELRNVHG